MTAPLSRQKKTGQEPQEEEEGGARTKKKRKKKQEKSRVGPFSRLTSRVGSTYVLVGIHRK